MAETSLAAKAMEVFGYQPKLPPTAKSMIAYRAPSLFQPSKARQALRDAHEGKIAPLLGLYLGLSNASTARFIAPMGFDVCWIDWEHSSCNVETMTDMVHAVQFMSEGRTIPFVRVPGADHAAIGYAMDAGASIVVTQVDTVEQAKHIIFSAKFGRKAGGGRSVPPFRLIPNLTDVRDDPKHHGDWCQASNDQAAIMIQIESLEGLENLDDILTQCPEIDAVWLGTLDIRVSMGLPGNGGLGGNEPEWHEALGKYFEITTKHNKSRGGFALGPDEVFSMMQERLDFIVCAAEVLQLTSLQCDLERARNLCAGRVKSAANGAAKAPKKEKDVAIADDKPANGSA